jgi:ornithine cyclodeaminase/alanine dehydrogenase-like protein (mu-crystallin family)
VFAWDDVRVWSRTQASVDRFLAEQAPKYPHLRITGTTDVQAAVEDADVIVTGTHARTWLVDEAWVKPGAHIAALGADLKGEQELDPRTLQRARVFVDDIRQCREDGEINVALAEGLIVEDDLAGEIGKVVCGELEGRQSDDQVTVFDSTGIALQDSATVPLEYERAVAAGVGVEKKMIST